MMTKIFAQRVKKDLWRLAILSLITVLVWLALVTYRTLTRSQVAPDVKKQLSPLTATLELDTMEQSTNRLIAPAIDWSALGQTAVVLVASSSANNND